MNVDKDIPQPSRTEFFECDCHDRDHLIRAEYSEFISNYKDGTFHVDRDLNIQFVVYTGDWEYDGMKDNFIKRKWNRLRWRIKKATRILFYGRFEVDGYFVPCRSLVDSHKQSIEWMFGYETTKNLAKWLDIMADKIKIDYEHDLVKYYGQENLTKKITI